MNKVNETVATLKGIPTKPDLKGLLDQNVIVVDFTKLNGDKYIIKSKCKYSILRLPGIFGFNGPKHLGLNNFIMSKLAKKKINFTGNLSLSIVCKSINVCLPSNLATSNINASYM